MDTAIRENLAITGIFSDAIFSLGCRIGNDGYARFSIIRPDGRIDPIVIMRTIATRDDKPLYWISGWNLPSMDESKIEKEIIKDIMECLVWETIR